MTDVLLPTQESLMNLHSIPHQNVTKWRTVTIPGLAHARLPKLTVHYQSIRDKGPGNSMLQSITNVTAIGTTVTIPAIMKNTSRNFEHSFLFAKQECQQNPTYANIHHHLPSEKDVFVGIPIHFVGIKPTTSNKSQLPIQHFNLLPN